MTIIDTPSHTPQIVPVTAEISDVVLVPFATSPVDYHPTGDTLRAITTPHAVLMTKVDRRTREEADLRQRLQAENAFVLETTIAYRMFFNRIYGTTPGADLHGYTEAARELETVVESLEKSEAGQLLA